MPMNIVMNIKENTNERKIETNNDTPDSGSISGSSTSKLGINLLGGTTKMLVQGKPSNIKH